MTLAETVRRIQFTLIESASCSADQLFAVAPLLSRPDYDDVVVERSIAGFCGYPPCSNALPVERDRLGRFRVSLREHRVYDLSETYYYCSEACVIRSRTFSTSLNTERVSGLSEAKFRQILRLFGDCNVRGDELEEEGDLEIKSLVIKEKVDAGAGEVPFDEWIGPANAIEGYVPQRDRSRDPGSIFIPQHTAGESGMPFSSGIFVANETLEVKNVEEASIAKKKTKPKKTKSKTSKVKLKKISKDYGNNNMDLSTSIIVGDEFGDGNDSFTTGLDISDMIAKQLENVVLEEKIISKNTGISQPSRIKHHHNLEDATNKKVVYTAVKELEYENLAEKTKSDVKLLKSSLKTSRSKAGSHSVKWADEENLLLEDEKIIPQESSKEDFDSSVRFTSAEACAIALIQAAESVASGKTEVGEAISEAGILILPQSQSLQDEEEVDDDIYKLERDIVKWPKKTVLLDTDMFEVQDSWHDTAPEGFSLNLSPFATMWMALFGWVNCSSLAYIYGCDESLIQNFLLVNGKDYPQKVTLRDGLSLEIRQALDGFICRTLPVLVKDQRLPVPVSTVEKSMGCLLDTMSFMDAIPSFRIRQWHVVVFLFIEALSVYRLPVLAPHLKSRGIPLQQMLNSAQFSSEEYEVMRDLVLPFGRSTEFSI